VIAIAWSAIFVRWANMPGVASAFYRMAIAASALWAFLLFARKRRTANRLPGRTVLLALLSGAFFAGDVALFNTAVLHTSAGSATFLANNAPLLVALLTWAITRKLPSKQFWAALLIALAGAWLIVAVDAHHLRSERSADLLAVLSSVCFALYLITTEQLRKSIDTPALITLAASGSSIALLAYAAIARVPLAIPDVRSFAAVAALALVCQLTGYFCLTYALGHLPVTVTSVVLLGVAPLTAIFAFALFHERLSPLQIFGGLLVICGVWIVTRHEGATRLAIPGE
jgi:drug/metabolite transporter (DMT)-like permease